MNKELLRQLYKQLIEAHNSSLSVMEGGPCYYPTCERIDRAVRRLKNKLDICLIDCDMIDIFLTELEEKSKEDNTTGVVEK